MLNHCGIQLSVFKTLIPSGQIAQPTGECASASSVGNHLTDQLIQDRCSE
jgi:hypothetical protein